MIGMETRVQYLHRMHEELRDAFSLIEEAEQCIDRIEDMLSWKTYFISGKIIDASNKARSRLHRREKIYNVTLRMHWDFNFFEVVMHETRRLNVRNGK